jgi:hypothetical protein
VEGDAGIVPYSSPANLSQPKLQHARKIIFSTQRYAIALFFVLLAFVPTLLVQHLFAYPFLFLFFGAVMANAWLGGTKAGLLAWTFGPGAEIV